MLEIERALAPCSGLLRSTSREPQNLRRGATTGPQGSGAEVKAEVAHLSPRTEVGHMGDSGGPLGSAGRPPKSTEKYRFDARGADVDRIIRAHV